MKNLIKRKVLVIVILVFILLVLASVGLLIWRQQKEINNIMYYEGDNKELTNLEYELECDPIEDELYVTYGIENNIKRNTNENITDYLLEDGIYVHDINIYSEDGKSTIIEMLVEDEYFEEGKKTGFNVLLVKEVDEVHAILEINDLEFKEDEIKKITIKVPNDVVGLRTIIIKKLGEREIYDEIN